MEEVKCSAHLTDSPVVTGHIVKGHGLAELVILTQLLGLLEQIQRTIDVLLLQIVNSQDIAYLAQLLAGAGELARVGAIYLLFPLKQLLEHANSLNILAFILVLPNGFLELVQLLLQFWVDLLLGLHISELLRIN